MAYEYRFDKTKCPYASVCGSYGIPEDCYSGCIRYMEMDFLMWAAQVPSLKKFNKRISPEPVDREAYDRLQTIKENICDFVVNGDNLYLYSKNYGNGKTTWSVKILMAFLNKVWCGNGFRPRAVFLHTPTFLKKLKDRISTYDQDFEDLIKRVETVDLVIWDDIGSTTLGNYGYENVLSFLEQRKFAGLSNIFTGNLSADDFEKNFDGRLRSKVCNESTIIELRGGDRRVG